MCDGEKGRGLRRREYVNGKVNQHIVYSQMNERMIGELILLLKNVIKNILKSKAITKSDFREKSTLSSSSFCFFSISRDFANSYPVVPPSYKSIPYWSPFSSLPPPVFLASAGTLPPAALSPILCLTHFLQQTTLSIFPSFFASVPFSCPLITLFPFLNHELPLQDASETLKRFLG